MTKDSAEFWHWVTCPLGTTVIDRNAEIRHCNSMISLLLPSVTSTCLFCSYAALSSPVISSHFQIRCSSPTGNGPWWDEFVRILLSGPSVLNKKHERGIPRLAFHKGHRLHPLAVWSCICPCLWSSQLKPHAFSIFVCFFPTAGTVGVGVTTQRTQGSPNSPWKHPPRSFAANGSHAQRSLRNAGQPIPPPPPSTSNQMKTLLLLCAELQSERIRDT